MTDVRDALLLDRSDTASAIDPGRLLAGVTRALVALSRGTASAPPRIAARSPEGLVGVMPAYVPGEGLAAKLVSVFAHGGPSGRAAHRGVVVLFDEADGHPIAIMDAEAITAARTAATATVAMRALANPLPRRAAIIGAGTQAQAQLDFLGTVGVGADVVLGVRDRARGDELAEHYPGVAVSTVRDAVCGADLILCCTSAREPVLRRTWLTAGAHVSSVGGSDGPEVDAATVKEASVFVEWRGAVEEPPPAGAHELQKVDPSRATLVGDVIDGVRPGRSGSSDLTLFKSTGQAALDVAAARVVYDVARARGVGRAVDL